MKHTRLVATALFSVASVQATAVAEQLQGLKNAVTAVDRIAVLKDDSDFVFDFAKGKATAGAGGETRSANIGNFPALFGAKMAMTLGFMQPCSINSPHTHPRATEVLLMINGTVKAGFLAENGAQFVMNTIEPMQAAVFPRGSIHFQANVGCQPVMFVATLNNEDPGTLQVAQRFFALPADVVGAALGGLGVKEVAELAKYVPDNLIAATEECFKACNIPPPAKGSQPTNQQQGPRPASTQSSGGSEKDDDKDGNDDDDTSNAPQRSGTPVNWVHEGKEKNGTSSDPSSSAGAAPQHKILAAANDEDQDDKDIKSWFADLPHDGTKIALLSLVLVNVLGIAGLIAFICARSAKKRKLAKAGGLETMATSTGAAVTMHGRSISAPRPLLAGSRGGKYEAAQYELPMDDAASADTFVARKYDDPYDRPSSRGPSPVPPVHSGPYRD